MMASSPKACGTASATTKVRIIATNSSARTWDARGSCAFVTHTNADHAHHTSASTSMARPKPAQVRSCTRRVETWVTANTKTRSQNSSTEDVRLSAAAEASTDMAAEAIKSSQLAEKAVAGVTSSRGLAGT